MVFAVLCLYMTYFWPLVIKSLEGASAVSSLGANLLRKCERVFFDKKRLAWRQGPGSGSTKTGSRRTGEVKLLCIGGTTTIKQLAECYLTIVLYKCAYFSYFGKYFLKRACSLGSI